MSATETSSITGGDLVRLVGTSNRQVHSWCLAGVFGPEQMSRIGSGNYRRFDATDVMVARACRRLVDAFDWRARNGRQFPMPVVVEVADQVRSGADVVRVRLGDHVELTVDIADLRDPAP